MLKQTLQKSGWNEKIIKWENMGQMLIKEIWNSSLISNVFSAPRVATRVLSAFFLIFFGVRTEYSGGCTVSWSYWSVKLCEYHFEWVKCCCAAGSLPPLSVQLCHQPEHRLSAGFTLQLTGLHTLLQDTNPHLQPLPLVRRVHLMVKQESKSYGKFCGRTFLHECLFEIIKKTG